MLSSKRSTVRRPCNFVGWTEPLEARIAPALDVLSIGGVTSASFTDADGDLITVRISGSKGSIDFSDFGNGDGIVEDGESIFSALITGASADFAVTFSVQSSLTSDSTVNLGAISANTSIRGIYTVPVFTEGVPASSFNLSSYTGPGLSPDGSINVTSIVGDGDGVALMLGSLGKDTAINVTNAINGAVTITKSIAGVINVGGSVSAISSEVWTIGGITPTGSISVAGNFTTPLTAKGAVAGTVSIGIAASGNWTLPSITASGSITAGTWNDLNVTGAMAGRILSYQSDTVTLGSITSKGSITSGGSLTVTVKSIPAGADIYSRSLLTVNLESGTKGHLTSDSTINIVASKNSDPFGTVGGQIAAGDSIYISAKSVTGLNAKSGGRAEFDVLGSFSKSTINVSSIVSVALGGSILNSRLLSEGMSGSIGGNISNSSLKGSEEDISINVSGSIINSEFFVGTDDIKISIGGNVVNSLFSTAEDNITLSVGGSVLESTVAGEDVTVSIEKDLVSSSLSGDEGDLNVSVTGSIKNSHLYCGTDDIIVSVGGNVIASSFHAPESSVSVTVGGNLVSSQLSSSGYYGSLSVSGKVVGSSIFASSSQTIFVGGDMTTTDVTSGEGLSINVGGKLLDSRLTTEGATELTVDGDFRAKLKVSTDTTTLTAGSVLAKSIVEANNLCAVIGGKLDGVLNARILDLAVGGNVGKLARIMAAAVGDLNSDNQAFSIAGDFGGRLDVTGSFDTGTGATATLVAGKVLPGAVLNFNGPFGAMSADEFIFGAMLGTMSINNGLTTKLTFDGDLNKLVIRGAIRDAIAVSGRVRFLSTGSLFTATDANDGTFSDGSGAVTGSLDTSNGHGTIVTTA